MRPSSASGFGSSARRDAYSGAYRPSRKQLDQQASPLGPYAARSPTSAPRSGPQQLPIAGLASRYEDEGYADVNEVARLAKSLNTLGVRAPVRSPAGGLGPTDEEQLRAREEYARAMENGGYGNFDGRLRDAGAYHRSPGNGARLGARRLDERGYDYEGSRYGKAAAYNCGSTGSLFPPSQQPMSMGAAPARPPLDEDLAYEQGRRDALRSAGAVPRGRAPPASPAQPSMQTFTPARDQQLARRLSDSRLGLGEDGYGGYSAEHGRRDAAGFGAGDGGHAESPWFALRSLVRSNSTPWLQGRLAASAGSGRSDRAGDKRGLAPRRSPREAQAGLGAEGSERLRLWYLEDRLPRATLADSHGYFLGGDGPAHGGSAHAGADEGEGEPRATSVQVDALEASLRRLLHEMEVSSGSRARALRRLFNAYPQGAAALHDGGGIGPREWEAMLLAIKVQWATRATAAALFERYDLDGSRTLTAAELEAMLFREGLGGRARVTLGRVREALAERGADGVHSMQDTVRQFRIFDEDRSGTIDQAEFRRGLELCLKGTAIWPLARADLDSLFAVFDESGDGRIAFEEFARAVRSPLSPRRLDLVLRAFHTLCAIAGADPRSGLKLREIAARYDAARHPMVVEGKATVGQVLAAFLAGFDKNEDAVVSLSEFVEYYTWLGWSLRDDRLFTRTVIDSLHLEDA